MSAITGKPVVDLPKLLVWPQYGNTVKPDITEPAVNTLNDLTGNIRDCDIMLSTAGNYHLALTELPRHVPGQVRNRAARRYGGEPAAPAGQQTGAHYAVRIQGDRLGWQRVAREKLIEALTPSQFGAILSKHDMQQAAPKLATAL